MQSIANRQNQIKLQYLTNDLVEDLRLNCQSLVEAHRASVKSISNAEHQKYHDYVEQLSGAIYEDLHLIRLDGLDHNHRYLADQYANLEAIYRAVRNHDYRNAYRYCYSKAD